MHEREDERNFQRPALALLTAKAPLDPEPEASGVEPPEAADVDQPAAPDETEGTDLMAAGDYPLLAAPSISLAAFTSILQNAKSPAAGEATGIFNALVKYGVDPAVGLAIFQHESSFGKSGTATKTLSIGNSRYYGDQGLGITKYVTASNGSFAKYPSYTVAAEDLGRLLSSSMYGKSANYNTVRTFAAKYAPAADHNSPSGYGAAVANAIAKWTGSAGSAFTGATATLDTHELHVQHLASLAAMGKGASGAASSAIAGLNTNHLLLILAAGGILLLVLMLLLRKGKGASVQTVKIEAAD